MDKDLAIVILAAGLGTRMKSDKAKVLHEILGRPMIDYVVASAAQVAGPNVIVVVGHQAEQVQAAVSRDHAALYALQPRQLGTGHAVRCALPVIPPEAREVIILCGDVPLIRPETLSGLLAHHRRQGRDLSLLAVTFSDPTGYGRVILDEAGHLCAIVEEADASAAQKAISVVNSGIFCVDRTFLGQALARIDDDNAQGELYLTDIVGVAYAEGKKAGVLISDDPEEITGINTLAQLALVESLMQTRKNT